MGSRFFFFWRKEKDNKNTAKDKDGWYLLHGVIFKVNLKTILSRVMSFNGLQTKTQTKYINIMSVV